MRKLYSQRLELIALRTISLLSEQRAGQYLLAKLTDQHFATETARATFKRILHTMKKHGSVPEWHELTSDPGLDETIKEQLDECDFEPIATKKSISKLVTRLNDYKNVRMLLDIGQFLQKKLNSTEPYDIDETVRLVGDKLQGTTQVQSFKVYRIGMKSNIEKHVDKLLSGTAIHYIPTGFAGFDDINRGLTLGSLMILAGETGAGKSLLLGQLANNLAMSGASIAVVPLEMSNDEVLQREVSRNSEVTMTELLDPMSRLSKKQKRETKEAFMQFDAKLSRRGGSISTYEFESSISAQQLMSTLAPFDHDVIVIDYIGLLDGLTGDDQWRAMMNAIIYLRMWAKHHNKLVIIAAQLSKEGLLRYSTGMADHANFMWIWKKDEVFKKLGIAMIDQPKARQASSHTFALKFMHVKMQVVDATEEDLKEGAKLRASNENGGGKKDDKNTKRWKDTGDELDEWSKDKKKNYGSDNDNNRRKKYRSVEI